MICSLAELGQEETSDGICVLEDHPTVGSLTPGVAVAPLLGLDDVVLDVAVTANRPDALSMLGIAREVAALCDATVSAPRRHRKPHPHGAGTLCPGVSPVFLEHS